MVCNILLTQIVRLIPAGLPAKISLRTMTPSKSGPPRGNRNDSTRRPPKPEERSTSKKSIKASTKKTLEHSKLFLHPKSNDSRKRR